MLRVPGSSSRAPKRARKRRARRSTPSSHAYTTLLRQLRSSNSFDECIADTEGLVSPGEIEHGLRDRGGRSRSRRCDHVLEQHGNTESEDDTWEVGSGGAEEVRDTVVANAKDFVDEEETEGRSSVEIVWRRAMIRRGCRMMGMGTCGREQSRDTEEEVEDGSGVAARVRERLEEVGSGAERVRLRAAIRSNRNEMETSGEGNAAMWRHMWKKEWEEDRPHLSSYPSIRRSLVRAWNSMYPGESLSDRSQGLLSVLQSHMDVCMCVDYPDAYSGWEEERVPIVCLHVLNNVFQSNALVRSHNVHYRSIKLELRKLVEERQRLEATIQGLRESPSPDTQRPIEMKELLAELAKIREREILQRDTLMSMDDDDSRRDQGFSRCKAVILTPMRNFARDYVECILQLVQHSSPLKNLTVFNRTRFEESFADDPLNLVQSSNKPDEYKHVFRGNMDDCFSVGISISGSSVRLFTPLMDADIIVASPLGLRLLFGYSEFDGEDMSPPDELDSSEQGGSSLPSEQGGSSLPSSSIKKVSRGRDFLSSVEILVLEQVESLLEQNWNHVRTCVASSCLMPKDPETAQKVDLNRIKSYVLDGLARSYCSLVAFSRRPSYDLAALFASFAKSEVGRLEIMQDYDGEISQVHVSPCRQNFIRVISSKQKIQEIKSSSEKRSLTGDDGDNYDDDEDDPLLRCEEERFQFFCRHFSARLRDSLSPPTILFVPSSLDFIRIRNHFDREWFRYVSCHDESSWSDIQRARSSLANGHIRLLIITERCYYFHRFRIRGAAEVFFYAPPENPNFYREFVNFVGDYRPSTSLSSSIVSSSSRIACSFLLFHSPDEIHMQRIVGSAFWASMALDSKPRYIYEI